MEDVMRPEALEPWLKQALKTQVTTAEKAIQKSKTDIEAQLVSLNEIVEDLLAKSEKDSTEKRDNRAVYRAAKAVNRMCLELQNLTSSPALAEPQSHEGLRQFSDATAKLANDVAGVRDRWIGYIRPYYILDTMSLNASIDKLRRLGEQAWEIFGKEGSLLKSFEEIQNKVEKIEELETSLQKQLQERDRITIELEKLDPLISEAEREIEYVAGDQRIAELRRIDAELKSLRTELLTSGFRRLGRPLRKLEAMSNRGEYPVSPEIREKLSEYLKRPFTTFIREGEGYPYLKSVMRTMREAVKRKKLVLKQREERKVLERVDNVAEGNILERIHGQATALVAKRREYLHDPACLELVHAYKQKKEDLKSLQSRHADLKHQSKLLSDKAETLRSSLVQVGKETGLMAEKLARRPVKLRLDTSLLSA